MKAKTTYEEHEMVSAVCGLSHVRTVDDKNRAEIQANKNLLASRPEWQAFCDEFEESYRFLTQVEDRRHALVAFAGKCFAAGRKAETLAAIMHRNSAA